MIEITPYGSLNTTWFNTTIRTLVFLAQRSEYVSSKTISEGIQVDASFIRRILNPFIQKGLVAKKSGRFGGYLLVAEPDSISLFDIYTLLVAEAKTPTPSSEADYTSHVMATILWETEKEFTKVLERYTISMLYKKS